MLKLYIPSRELFDESRGEFSHTKGHVLQLEHSLVSLSKWESKWEKPFLNQDKKTVNETLDYIRCMTITQNVDDAVYSSLTQEDVNKVNAYIEKPMTATTFRDEKGKINREIITSEIIYYWMIALNIPMECQKWHLNRLLTLINVCNIKNQPKKKMSTKEYLAQRRALNAARRKRHNSTG